MVGNGSIGSESVRYEAGIVQASRGVEFRSTDLEGCLRLSRRATELATLLVAEEVTMSIRIDEVPMNRTDTNVHQLSCLKVQCGHDPWCRPSPSLPSPPSARARTSGQNHATELLAICPSWPPRSSCHDMTSAAGLLAHAVADDSHRLALGFHLSRRQLCMPRYVITGQSTFTAKHLSWSYSGLPTIAHLS